MQVECLKHFSFSKPPSHPFLFFSFFWNLTVGDLYDSLCEELSGSSIKQVFLSADEGIGRRHVQASMRFPTLNLLHLVRLGNLGDLISLAADWPCPPTLNQLVLVKPDLPGTLTFSFGLTFILICPTFQS